MALNSPHIPFRQTSNEPQPELRTAVATRHREDRRRETQFTMMGVPQALLFHPTSTKYGPYL